MCFTIIHFWWRYHGVSCRFRGQINTWNIIIGYMRILQLFVRFRRVRFRKQREYTILKNDEVLEMLVLYFVWSLEILESLSTKDSQMLRWQSCRNCFPYILFIWRLSKCRSGRFICIACIGSSLPHMIGWTGICTPQMYFPWCLSRFRRHWFSSTSCTSQISPKDTIWVLSNSNCRSSDTFVRIDKLNETNRNLRTFP